MARFELVLIKPSHYDDDGYVLQFFRSVMPSNTLAALAGIAEDCIERRVLGADTEIRITPIDEVNTRVRVPRLLRRIQRAGAGMVGLVGVQSNQYPRALDLARRFRSAGIPVCIGGFHVSGCLAMLPGVTPELQEALDLGVSLFAGEAEGRLDRVLRDARDGTMEPIYNYLDDLPELEGAPVPMLSAAIVGRNVGSLGSFDAGRGCPFKCSFCTIINVQGRKSRYRSADDVEHIVRRNLARGIKSFFVTDDDFARNRNWEAIFDRLIEMRERESLDFHLSLQLDTACHRIPGFIEKAGRAGVRQVFVGLESINPASLASAQKGQNRIADYRAMLQAWRSVRAVTIAGFIVGFPDDTPESVARDIEIIKRELPVDLLTIQMLTPLPGSEDHRRMVEAGTPIDSDLNRYDLHHPTTEHPRMSRSEWTGAYRDAWSRFFTPEHVETLLRRAWPDRIRHRKLLAHVVVSYGSIHFEGVPPLEAGVFRRRSRTDRRPGLPVESAWRFYPMHLGKTLGATWRALQLFRRYSRLAQRIRREPDRMEYSDLALTPASPEDVQELELFAPMPPAIADPPAGEALVQLGRRASTA